MAEDAAFAFFYFIFAIVHAVFDIRTQDISQQADMYTSSLDRYADLPWQREPFKYLRDIATPDDLHRWFSEVFVPVTFIETPRIGQVNGFCTPSNQCGLNQGDCDNDGQCRGAGTCGDPTFQLGGLMVNGRYWETGDLVTWCDYLGTPVDIFLPDGAAQACTTDESLFDTVQPCCWDRHTEGYITSFTSSTPERYGTNCPPSIDAPSVDCCVAPTPEPLTRNQTEQLSAIVEQPRSVSLASYNTVLMARFTMKRYRDEADNGPHFRGLVPMVVKGKGPLSPHKDNGVNENKASWESILGETYVWNTIDSYKTAGGYVQYFLPSQGETAWETILQKLFLDHWFDQRMATAAMELLLYNGNTDTFMFVLITFRFHLVGECDVHFESMFANLRRGEWMRHYWVTNVIEWILILAIVFTFVYEFSKIRSAGCRGHFMRAIHVLEMFSMLLCTATHIVNQIILYNQAYDNFSFSGVLEASTAREELRLITNWMSIFEFYRVIAAINLFVIFLRAAMVMTTLEGNFGLLTNTIVASSSNLSMFALTLLTLLAGYVFFGWFAFGHSPGLSGMTDWMMSFYLTFTMLLGQEQMDNLMKIDSLMAHIFYYSFYITMYFVMLNMFISILLSGYDICLHELNNKERGGSGDVNFIRKIIKDYIFIFSRAGVKVREGVGGVWSRCIRPFIQGITSCFRECVYMCCNCFIPSGSRGPWGGFSLHGKGSHQESTVDKKAMRKELERSRKQLLETAGLLNKPFMKEDREKSLKVKEYRDRLETVLKEMYEKLGYKGEREKGAKEADKEQPGDSDEMRHSFELWKGQKDSHNIKDVQETEKTTRKINALLRRILNDPTQHAGPKKDHGRGVEDRQEKHEMTIADLQSLRRHNNLLEDLIDEVRQGQFHLTACISTLVFMGVFIVMMQLTMHSTSPFLARQAVLMPLVEDVFQQTSPLRYTDFSSIKTMNDVGAWAHSTFTEQLYHNTACMVVNHTSGTVSNSVSAAQCQNARDDQQLVQQVANWNIGFLNSTFVRVTIQPACYFRNTESRWSEGAPFIRSREMEGPCGSSDCYARAWKAQKNNGQPYCLNSFGEPIDVLNNKVPGLGDRWYNYSDEGLLGPFALTGGYTAALGVTETEARRMIQALIDDQWFTKNSVAIVFDWITYNGNFDLFTTNEVLFSSRNSGGLEKSFKSHTFPLHFFNGGPISGHRLAILVLFIVYCIMLLYYIAAITNGLMKEQTRCRNSDQPPLKFFYMYYRSVWAVFDSVSLILSIASIAVLADFYLTAFRVDYKFSVEADTQYQVPNNVVQSFGMFKTTDPRRPLQNDWYIFHQFEELERKWVLFVTLAACNSFLISIKACKHMNMFERVRVFSNTIASGAERNAYFLLVIGMMLVGSAFFFCILFGSGDPELSGVWKSVITLFQWMLGEFRNENLIRRYETWGIVLFIIFEVFMNFIAINMFLATMLNTYAISVGEREIEKTRAKMIQQRDNDYKEVDYATIEEFQLDVTLVKDGSGDGEIWVERVKGNGLAEKKGVRGGGKGVGHMLFKVNGDKERWKDYEKVEELYDPANLKKDDVHQKIHIMFRESHVQKPGVLAWLDPFKSSNMATSGHRHMKASVRTFWRKYGAVTQIHQEELRDSGGDEGGMDGKGDEEEDEDAIDDGEEKAATDAAGPDSTAGQAQKQVKTRVKKKLDALLFTRAGGKAAGRDDADQYDGHADSGMDGKASGEKTTEAECEIDDLIEAMERQPVTGEEVWLDCLLTAIEHEPDMEDESVFTEVLRTADMQDQGKGGQTSSQQAVVNQFHRMVSDVLSILEFKAKKKYYSQLQAESLTRKVMFEQQNKVLHDYACQLETEFASIMEKIHRFKQKKDMMISKLSGLLDKEAYGSLGGQDGSEETYPNGERRRPGHLQRLTMPWPDSQVSSG